VVSQVGAFDEFVAALRALGRVDGPSVEVRVAVARGIAEQIDMAIDGAPAVLWREYRAALEDLMVDDGDGDELDDDLRRLSPHVDHSPPA